MAKSFEVEGNDPYNKLSETVADRILTVALICLTIDLKK